MEKQLNIAMFDTTSSEQLQNCYFHSNWDTMDQNDPFESALSSMVSSPTGTSNGGGEGIMIRELIGRLGSICDSSAVSLSSPPHSTNNSCYNTPLNSPPKLHANFPNCPPTLPHFNADPGFVERAAKFSPFGCGVGVVGGEMGIMNKKGVPRVQSGGKLSRVNSHNERCSENVDSREGSSVSEQNPPTGGGGEITVVKSQAENTSRKRKAPSKSSKVKDSPAVKDDHKVERENVESNAKKSKANDEEAAKQENEGDCNDNSKEKQNIKDNSDNINKEAEKPEPPKDYIHVRARRGQATDSHSLAERVRREKISERMKFLQDLVPGCNKVTGKATVLDEIINYVQSLQRQVEFLSMKLATVNPRMEFNMDTLLANKDVFQSRESSVHQGMYPIDQSSAQAFPFAYQNAQQMLPALLNGSPNGMDSLLHVAGIQRNPALQLPSIDGFSNPMTQLPSVWEDDLQSLVQMGIAQNQTVQSAAGSLPNAQMKVEL